MQEEIKLGAGAYSVNLLYSFSSGNFCVPRNSICSQKWARPGSLAGSLMLPMCTFMAAAALSVVGSETRIT